MCIMQINFDAVSATTAAEIIGCTTGRVRQLLRDGAIRGKKIGERAWAVSRVDAEKLAETPAKTGRPRKVQQS
jgi:DNA-directed RNA polymerase specialized sigma24 family protein